MPEGQPLSCPNPSGSPLLDSWTPNLNTTTTTTTTLSPQEDAISIPVSGSFCEIVQEIDPPEYLDDCIAYSIENTASSPTAFGIVRYYDCYTNEFQSVIVESQQCFIIYSMVEPQVTFNSEYVSPSGIGDSNDSNDGSSENGGGGNNTGDSNEDRLSNSFQSIVITPKPCEPPPDPAPPERPPQPEPPEPPEPQPPEQPQPPPEDPDLPPEEPIPSGEPLPSGEADPPLPETSNINYMVIGEVGPNARPATENQCYRVTTSCPISDVRRANSREPIVYINDSKFPARMRRDTNYYLPSDNADNDFIYTYDENRKNDYRFTQKAAFSPARDNYYYGTIGISGIDDSGTHLTINYNSQSLKEPQYVNKPTVILNIYDVDTNLHKTYLLPPIDVDAGALIDPRNYVSRRDPETGSSYLSYAREGVEFKKTRNQNYKEINIAPINEENIKTYLEAWESNEVWMTKQSPGRLVSNRMIGWDIVEGEVDRQADGLKPNAYFMTGYGANGPNTKIPLGYTFLFQNDFLLKVNEPVLPTSTRLKLLTNPIGLDYGLRLPYDVDNFDKLKGMGLKQLLLNTYWSTYVTCNALTGDIDEQHVDFPPNFTDDEELREQYSFATHEMLYKKLQVPTIRSEHFILKHAFLAIYDNGSISDVTPFLLPDMPLATAKSYDILRGNYFSDMDAEDIRSQNFYTDNGTSVVGTFQNAEGWRVQKWALNRDQTIGVVPEFASQYVSKWGYTKEQMAEKCNVNIDQVIYWQTNEQLVTPFSSIVASSGLPIMPDAINRFSTADFINSIR